MNFQLDADMVKTNIEEKLLRHFGALPGTATKEQVFKAVAMTVRDILTRKRGEFKHVANLNGAKRVYYLCMEFMLGRSLRTNLCNLGLSGIYSEVLGKLGFDIEEIYDIEPDAGLGSGGLGRLAACFMDSLSSLNYPATGFSICYEYGLFRQKIIDGIQIELPDIWLPRGEVWLIPRTDRAFVVRFGGRVKEVWKEGRLQVHYEDCEEVEAVAYDMMISGADCEAVSPLRLWRARDLHRFNMGLFTQGQYTRALEESNNAEIISKVLYPSDNHTEGKLLRLSQQYFLASASVQSMIHDHMAVYKTLDNFPEKVAIHINDTHPALCIPELIRILIDEYYFDWERAWDCVTRCVSYTNHTVMPEALECWNEALFKLRLPRIYAIIKEINERFCQQAWNVFPGAWKRISDMSILGYGQIRMANLSIVGSHHVNGVSKLHSEILKESTFREFYRLWPHKFTNVTNGIAHRRWLCYVNPGLAALLDECIGPDYRTHPERLMDFLKFADDPGVLRQLRAIKHENKVRFAKYAYAKTGQKIDNHSVYDMQIKRMHEYKRQLLNALNIIGLYLELKDNPGLDMQPQTFIFGGKAAPGYHMARRIISLICMLSREIDSDPQVCERLRVIFLENYDVSEAEILMPAAEISEQISLAGKEASGTGCMKLMMNGAITIGTLDGANVEILEAVGKENMYIFGLSSREVDELWLRGYNSVEYYAQNEKLTKIIGQLQKGFAGESFADIASYLIASHGVSDPYMCLADFESYRLTRESMICAYADREKWNRMSLCNIASSGYFAADRSIRDYAREIWGIEEVSTKAAYADKN
ncbi:MAG TPA: glycogen/starch/alpha-glucan phosphorylase [Clostridiales bacterium]|nr:glycogen/starch/alpha-glucan phosphorylase [Clostridiales bacterium]